MQRFETDLSGSVHTAVDAAVGTLVPYCVSSALTAALSTLQTEAGQVRTSALASLQTEVGQLRANTLESLRSEADALVLISSPAAGPRPRQHTRQYAAESASRRAHPTD